MLGVGVGLASNIFIKRRWGEVVTVMGLGGFLLICSQFEGGLRQVSLAVEMDSLGWSLRCLSVWVVALCLLSRVKIKERGRFDYLFNQTSRLLLIFLLLRFRVSNFFFFYVRFECCLVPVFIIIVGWGYQPERAQAGTYLVFYTLLGSFPLFLLILRLGVREGRRYIHTAVDKRGGLFFFSLVAAFLVKFPIYGLHLWLLKAHVEAPVAGSMVLAGVLLKLGGYGLIRCLAIWGGGLSWVREAVILARVWGGVVVGLRCLRQTDIKILIARSSVVHISMCVGGVLRFRGWGHKGCLIIIIGHGLCSSGLFYLANTVYLRRGRRRLLLSKGLLRLMPSLSLWWFLLCSVNISAPPTLNLVREIGLILRLLSLDLSLLIVLAALRFLSAAYTLYLFSVRQHGSSLVNKCGFRRGSVREYLICSLH